MRIASIEPEPFHSFPFRNARSGGGTETVSCALYRAVVDRLPENVDALVCASDLQGVVGARLLGVHLVDELADLAASGKLPSLDRVGAVLAGDLYSAPRADKRGATGDVTEVWRAFAQRLAFVAGVAGNHDIFHVATVKAFPGAHLLDGDVVDVGGVRFGGVCGVIGNSDKNWRRREREFTRALRAVLDKKADVVVLHNGPDADLGELRGHPAIREELQDSRAVVVVCGHCYWPRPMAELRGGTQVLSADGRVVVLTAAR